MTKKNTKKAKEVINTNTSAGLKEYFEKYTNVSLRKLAQATNLNYGVLLKKSKEPVVGEAYDPEAINWSALDKVITSHNVALEDLDWDVLNAAVSKGATLSKNIDDFKVGQKYYIRKNATTPYEIIYKTDTHIVLMLEGTSEPISWSHNTFLLNGPSETPRAVKAEASVKVEEGEVEE